MKKSHNLTPEDMAFIDAMATMSPTQAFNTLLADIGVGEPADEPVHVNAIPQDQWIDAMKIHPTPAIQQYLDSGDTLTHHTLEMMELAIERAYDIQPPWCVDCARTGHENDGTLRVLFFQIFNLEP